MNVKNTCCCLILVEYGSFHHGKPSVFLEHNTKPHELVEKVITDEFLNTCNAATNAHGEDDEQFTRLYPDSIPKDESGRALLKEYLAIEWHLLLLGYKRREWTWLVDSLKSQEKIKEVMKRKTYSLLGKHFRTDDHRGLPNRDDPSFTKYPKWRELSSK